MSTEPFCPPSPSGSGAATVLLALSLFFAPSVGAADQNPLELQKIMQELGEQMQLVAGAISREDWEAVADTAPKIAKHRAPPFTEKARIMAFLGSHAAEFRAADRQAHDAAMKMGGAAQRRDGEGVIHAYAEVQQACLACHQAHRAEFRAHFYGSAP